MAAPFHPRDEQGRWVSTGGNRQEWEPRVPWYDRKNTISRPNFLALWTAWFAYWLRPRGAFGGAFVLAILVLVGVDLWRVMPYLRRQPRWLQQSAVGALLLGVVLGYVLVGAL